MSPTGSIIGCIRRLEEWFNNCPGAVVAFSGGVDSSLVAFVSRRFLGRENSFAVISASPSLKMSELEVARSFAMRHDIRLEVIVTGEIENPNYFNNPVNRCYYCKDALYTELEGLRKQYPDWWVVNGTNADDAGDYRPGLTAASEHAVRAPLAECGIDKEAVRAMSEHFELECWNKPASPCLASRIPYGERVTVEKMRQIERGEAFLESKGFPVSRVRHFGETARIEIPPERFESIGEIWREVVEEFRSAGFSEVTLDREGYVSGKLNRLIGQAK